MRLNPHHTAKQHVLFLTAFFTVVLVLAVVVSYTTQPVKEKPLFGITYSSVYAKQLGLDWQEAYEAMLRDLGVRDVRIPVYWSEVERTKNNYDWSEVDWLIETSERYGANVTLAIGMKVPRWPECYVPDWAEMQPSSEMNEEVVEFVGLTVERYREHDTITRWQLENEPFFPFGVCPDPDPQLFEKEIEAVRIRDDRPLQLTVSGELEPWLDLAVPADVLGTSMYRVTWNNFFGYFYYPIGPGFYRAKVAAVDPFVDTVVISELQAEPWFPEPIKNRTPAEWAEVFDGEVLTRNVDFASRTGVDEAYLWGAEWWYFLHQHNESELWDAARELFRMP